MGLGIHNIKEYIKTGIIGYSANDIRITIILNSFLKELQCLMTAQTIDIDMLLIVYGSTKILIGHIRELILLVVLYSLIVNHLGKLFNSWLLILWRELRITNYEGLCIQHTIAVYGFL